MRLNDFGLLAIVLLSGLLMGVVGTLGIYNSVASHQAEVEQKEKEETIKNLEFERDQLQAQINDYAEAERNKNQVIEQPGAEEGPARAVKPQRPAVAAAPRPEAGAPKKGEKVPTRDEKTDTPAKPALDPNAGFGPPREYGGK
jgi:cell division protein FtsN